MQTVAAGFTAEERDSTRSIVGNVQVSWKKETNLAATTFTIGVSMIGGSDLIGINPGAIGSPSNYNYFDESEYVTGLAYERSLNMPTGGLTKALGEVNFDNTSGRFTPRYLGGSSELFTAILPRRPFIINAGFNYGGVDQTIAQLTGVTTKQPSIDIRNRDARIQGADYIEYFQGRYLDKTAMFTSATGDVVLEQLFLDSGMSTSQYSLDPGINVIPYGVFEKGTRLSDAVHKIAQAENGFVFQDESGKFRFWNRYHFNNTPYNAVQQIIYTGQVVEQGVISEDDIINVVEVKGKVFEKQPQQIIYALPSLTSIEVPANSGVSQFFEADNPILQIVDPTSGGTQSYYLANSKPDGTGIDKTSSLTVTNRGTFTNAVKYEFTNSDSVSIYITKFVFSGRVAKKVTDLYYRDEDDSSLTAYQERPFVIENEFIQDAGWAAAYARMILDDFAEPDNMQKLVIRAKPSLQLGDLISWQGRYWRIYGIKSSLSASSGYTQELTLIQKTVKQYFQIGISAIGGSDEISA